MTTHKKTIEVPDGFTVNRVDPVRTPKVRIKLSRLDRIVAVVPETCSGPGWMNQVVWVHIVSYDNKYRLVTLQLDDMTPEMCVLFKICEQAHNDMMSTVFCITEHEKEAKK